MDPIEELLTSYAELNGSHITELETEPSPLEFMRFVALNTPFVVKNATSEWRATRLWSSSYIRNAMRGQIINVAVTPHGFDLHPGEWNEIATSLH
jgi:jumonji domain-containing protein 7